MDTTNNNSSGTHNRSVFVTVIAWLLIIFSGFTMLVSIAQNIILNVYMKDEFQSAFKQSDMHQELMPGIYGLMFQYFNVFIFLFLIITIISFAGSIGLLLRKNWGRLITITVLTLGIVFTIISMYLQHAAMESMRIQQEEFISSYQQTETLNNTDEEECCENDPCCDQDNVSSEYAIKDEEIKRMRDEFDKSTQFMMWFTYIFVLIFTVFQVLIIWKLTRPEIVSEFVSAK